MTDVSCFGFWSVQPQQVTLKREARNTMRSTRTRQAKSKPKSRRPGKQAGKANETAYRVPAGSPGNEPSALPTEMHIETPASAKGVEILPHDTGKKKPRQ